jgi:hypothetical protein
LLDDFIRYFAPCPVGDWSFVFLRWLAGQGFDLAALVSRDATRRSWTRGISQTLFRTQVGQSNRLQRHPPPTPQAHGVDGDALFCMDRIIRLALGGSQNDPRAQGDLLRGSMPPYQLF